MTVTIRNAGTAAVNDAFWVDVYFNPTQMPTVNHPWDAIASHGAVWGVTDPIPVGGSLVLPTGSKYYFGPPDSSAPPLPTQAGLGLPPRKPPPPAQPPGGDDDDRDPTPDGAYIVLHVPSAPAGVWTIVQWQDTAGGWHDIESWSGALDEGNQKVWWLGPGLFGKGPFRWLVYQSAERDTLLASSDPFYLPEAEGEKLWVEVSLSK